MTRVRGLHSVLAAMLRGDEERMNDEIRRDTDAERRERHDRLAAAAEQVLSGKPADKKKGEAGSGDPKQEET